jgi:uncharacterized protein YwqG
VGIGDWFRKRSEAREATRAAEQARREAEDAALAAALETTRRPFVRVTVDTDVGTLRPTASKLGGVPYVPLGSEPPPPSMLFLAQLDFAEIPPLDGLPREGLLQFWIEDDDTYGLFDRRGAERTDGHRCIYHASIETSQTPGIAPTGQRGPLCFSDRDGRRLRFAPGSELLTPGDYEWDAFVEKHGLDPHTEIADDAWEDSHGHKIGGYCAFTQGDPRTVTDPMWSLLQLDSDEHVFWGDTGIAHWFIREADLRARNFANVRYYWDCC